MLVANPNAPCPDTSYHTIHLSAPPNEIALSILNIEPQCFENNSFSFDIAGQHYNNVDYEWDFGPNANIPNASIPNPTNISFNQPGSFWVYLNAVTPSCEASDSVLVTVYPPLDVSLELLQDTGCAPYGIQFDGLSESIPGASYGWSFGDGNFSTVQSPFHVYQNSGIYDVSFFVSYNTGCTDTFNLFFPELINILETPNAQISNIVPQCFENNSFSFSAAGQNPDNSYYDWHFGSNANVQNSNLPNPVDIIFNQAGDYWVYLEINTPYCSANDSVLVTVYPPLDISLELSQDTGCAPYGIQFDGISNTISGASYGWSFGDGNFSTEHSPFHTYQNAGSYDVSFFVSYNTGCTDTFNLFFPELINILETPNAQISNVVPQCFENNSFSFSVAGQNPFNSYFEWNFGTNANVQNSNLINPENISFNQAGEFWVYLEVSTSICSTSDSVLVTVYPPLDVSLTLSQDSGCAPYNVQFDGLTSNNTEISYLWSFGDGNFSIEQSPFHVYQDAGLYDVSVTVINNIGCTDTLILIFPDLIHVFESPNPQINAVAPQCFENNSFNFSAGGENPSNAAFEWNFGLNANIQTSNLPNPENVVFNQAGDYWIHLSISTPTCSAKDSTLVSIFPALNVSLDLQQIKACLPYGVQFEGIENAPSTLNYLWNFGDGNFSLEHSPYYFYKEEGTYNVSLSIFNTAGCKDTIHLFFPNLIQVYESPIAGISADPLLQNIATPHVTFTDLSIGSTSCELHTGDGLFSNNCNLYHTYSETGTYDVYLIARNDAGCSDTAYIKVKIEPIFSFYIPNSFSPNGDNVNDYFYGTGKGIKEYEMLIFNRWGNEIFRSTDINEKWDGMMPNGQFEAPIDVYVYKVNLVNDFKERKTYIGRVTLIR
jgi:gliding motility-associated-like protein